jgi:transcription termination factor Rho
LCGIGGLRTPAVARSLSADSFKRQARDLIALSLCLLWKRNPFRLRGHHRFDASPTLPPPKPASPNAPLPRHSGPPPAPCPRKTLVRVEGMLDIDLQKRQRPAARPDPRRQAPAHRHVCPEGAHPPLQAAHGPDHRRHRVSRRRQVPESEDAFIESVDGVSLEDRRAKFDFTNLTTVSPNQQLKMEMKDGR